jgi:hypothetical protein
MYKSELLCQQLLVPCCLFNLRSGISLTYEPFSLKQRYGQPPQDIVNEIAPGLELDEDGMPKMNPMEGMPFGGGNEECTIM